MLWREGDKPRCFHMKDVYRVDQKRTKGKRDGRLHVTLSPACGFYRYRLDFPDEAACARAADAMLEHRSYKAPQQIKLRVCSSSPLRTVHVQLRLANSRETLEILI